MSQFTERELAQLQAIAFGRQMTEREMLRNLVKKNIRNTLGGQFTEREAMQLLNSGYNPFRRR